MIYEENKKQAGKKKQKKEKKQKKAEKKSLSVPEAFAGLLISISWASPP